MWVISVSLESPTIPLQSRVCHLYRPKGIILVQTDTSMYDTW